MNIWNIFRKILFYFVSEHLTTAGHLYRLDHPEFADPNKLRPLDVGFPAFYFRYF